MFITPGSRGGRKRVQESETPPPTTGELTDFLRAYIPSTGNVDWGPPALTSSTLNASGDRYAYVIRVPKSGVLHSFEFRTAAVANNPDNGIRLSFQDIDTGTGFPDGVQDQYCDITGTISATTWQVPGHALTNDGSSGGTKRTVTAGQRLGCVVDFVSFVASDSFQVAPLTLSTRLDNWYSADGSSGAYAQSNATANIALKYDDGTYAVLPFNWMPATAVTTRTFNTGSTPDERALRFQVPVDCRCNGAWVLMDLDNPADFILYDASSNVLASYSFVVPERINSAGRLYFVFFDPTDLTRNTTYRLAVKPTTGSSVSVYDFDVPSNAYLGAVEGGIQWYTSTRSDGGAWSDTTTNRPWMGLALSGFIDSGS